MIRRSIFSDDLPMDARMLNVVYLVGMVIAFAVMIVRALMGLEFILVAIRFCMVISIAIIMYLCNRFRLYTICTWAVIVIICYILIPAVFLLTDGPNGSISGFFILSIVVIFLMMRGKNLYV